MSLQIGGTTVGQNVYDSGADGSFSSVTSLKVGSISLNSKVTGHLKDGVLVDYIAVSQAPTGETTTLTLAGGTLSSVTAGKVKQMSPPAKTSVLMGNLHPQFTASALLAAEKALNEKPGANEVTVQAFLVDVGATVPLKIRRLAIKKVTVQGKEETAQPFGISVGALDFVCSLNDAKQLVSMDVPSQRLHFTADGWNGIYVDPLAKFPELSQSKYSVKTETGIHMKTRDGVDLACDIVRPDDTLKHPAILVRTPYGRASETLGGAFWASRGYAYVTQDCRGREESGGEWDPFIHEGKDGADTIAWVARQQWCDGKIGMIGGSYVGYVQWAAAVENPPALKCIVPQVSPPDAMHNLPYEYGVFALYPDLWWAKVVAGRTMDASSLHGALPHPDKLTTLPLGKLDDAVLGKKLVFFDRWLSRTTIGDWKGWDFNDRMANSHVPALHISGTWDGDGIGTHLNWAAMRKLGRKDQWMVFGPWVHAFNTTHSLGDVEYGPEAIIEIDSLYVRWFDTWLKGKDVGLKKVPRVHLFVTGANRWVDLPDWPTPSTPPRTMYLSVDALSARLGKSEVAAYTYDPAKDTKIPSELLSPDPTKATTRIGNSELKRQGTLFFAGPPLLKKTAIAGPFSVDLHFTSSARDTDLFAMLVDVSPDGTKRIIGQAGKLRASYLAGDDKIRPLTPGREYVANLVPWDFAHQFAAGHRMGLMITASMFPLFARNLGTTDPIKTATRMVVQHNQILMGTGHPSSVTFHLLWEK